MANSTRANRPQQRTHPAAWGRLQTWHRERFLFRRPLHQAGANRFDAHAHRLHVAVDFNLDALQVRLEFAPRLTGDFATDAAQVLRLAAASVAVSERRLLTGDGALLAHDPLSLTR